MVTHKNHKHLSPTKNVDSTVDNVRRVKNIIEMAKHFWLFCYCKQHFVKAKKYVHKFCIVIIYINMYMCIHSYANLLISQGFTQNVTAICYSCVIIQLYLLTVLQRIRILVGMYHRYYKIIG